MGVINNHESSQIAWNRPNTIGHTTIDGKIDQTEGFGGFDAIFEKQVCGERIFDNGGGSSDANRNYVKERYNKSLSVYDPFMRSEDHNREVLNEADKNPFDASVSISVLNVINNKESRIEHITRNFEVITEEGKSFFIVWPGNGSGEGQEIDDGYQSNKGIESYVDEISEVFREKITVFNDENMAIATKHSNDSNNKKTKIDLEPFNGFNNELIITEVDSYTKSQ